MRNIIEDQKVGGEIVFYNIAIKIRGDYLRPSFNSEYMFGSGRILNYNALIKKLIHGVLASIFLKSAPRINPESTEIYNINKVQHIEIIHMSCQDITFRCNIVAF